MNKDDRRFKKTEKALCRALSELVEEKPIFKITIDELVDRADIHRSTFYTHYQDIYDLYNTLKDSFFDAMVKNVKEETSHDYTGQYASCVNFLEENKWLARLFLGKNADSEVSRQLGEFLKEQILAISAFEDHVSEIPASWHYLCAYDAGGIIALLRYWVSNDFQFDKEELVQLMIKLDAAFDNSF